LAFALVVFLAADFLAALAFGLALLLAAVFFALFFFLAADFFAAPAFGFALLLAAGFFLAGLIFCSTAACAFSTCAASFASFLTVSFQLGLAISHFRRSTRLARRHFGQ